MLPVGEAKPKRAVPWRGILVIATWLLWPPIYISAEYVVRFMTSTSRRCSIEGCLSLEGWAGALSDAVTVGPPAVATVLWVRWRRRKRTAG